MATFKIEQTIDITGATVDYVIKTDNDGKVWVVPNDPANSDYQAYLASLEAPQG